MQLFMNKSPVYKILQIHSDINASVGVQILSGIWAIKDDLKYVMVLARTDNIARLNQLSLYL